MTNVGEQVAYRRRQRMKPGHARSPAAAQGYVVKLAENAKELLEPSRDPVDLVLLDIEMPEVSGLDALQQLRDHYSAASCRSSCHGKSTERRYRQSAGPGR